MTVLPAEPAGDKPTRGYAFAQQDALDCREFVDFTGRVRVGAPETVKDRYRSSVSANYETFTPEHAIEQGADPFVEVDDRDLGKCLRFHPQQRTYLL